MTEPYSERVILIEYCLMKTYAGGTVAQIKMSMKQENFVISADLSVASSTSQSNQSVEQSQKCEKSKVHRSRVFVRSRKPDPINDAMFATLLRKKRKELRTEMKHVRQQERNVAFYRKLLYKFELLPVKNPDVELPDRKIFKDVAERYEANEFYRSVKRAMRITRAQEFAEIVDPFHLGCHCDNCCETLWNVPISHIVNAPIVSMEVQGKYGEVSENVVVTQASKPIACVKVGHSTAYTRPLDYEEVCLVYNRISNADGLHAQCEANQQLLSKRENERLVENFFKRHEIDFIMTGGDKAGTIAYYQDRIQNKACRLEFIEMSRHYIRSRAEKREKQNAMQTQGDEVLEAVASVSGEANITFVDERPTDTTAVHTTTNVTSKDPNADLADNAWNMRDVLTREVLVMQDVWKVGTTYDKKLGIPKLITDKINALVTSQLKLFGFLRASVEIRVQLNGTKFHNGRLIAMLRPLMWDDDEKYYNFYNNFTCWPHAFLDASVSNTVILKFPYSHLLSNLPQRADATKMTGIEALGLFHLYSFNNLRAATGSTQELPVTVYARLVNPEVHQPTFPITSFSYGNGIMKTPAVLGADPLMETQGSEGLFKGVIARGLGGMAHKMLDNVTFGAFSSIGDTISGALGLNFDKPSDPIPPQAIVNRGVHAPCHGVGLDFSTRLGLCQEAQTTTEVAQLGGEPDFNLATLCQIPCLYDIIYWKTSDAANSSLLKMAVSPSFLPDSRFTLAASDVGTPKLTEIKPSMLNYISRAFNLWRGGFKLKVQVVATQFHSGRLAIIYDPTMTDNRAFDINEQMNHNMVVMDIQEQKELEIDIPYMSIKPWLRCDRLRTSRVFAQTDYQAFKIGEWASGVVYIAILNPLVAPSNVASEVEINVYWYADNNFELAVPIPVDPNCLQPFSPIVDNGYNIDYTVVTKQEDLSYFANKEYILEIYYWGQNLVKMQKLVPASDKWYNASPNDSLGWDDEVFQWQYDLRNIRKYAGSANVQDRYIEAFPNYVKPTLMVQGAEEMTTTRDDNMTSITPTKGKRVKSVVAQTISENAMDLQTVLRRSYPLMVTQKFQNTNGYTLISIPVNPSFVPRLREPVGILYGVTPPQHNLAWFTRLFAYWRGSLRYKFIFNNTGYEALCFHAPSQASGFSIKSGMTELNLQKHLAFATQLATTQVQGSMDVEVPFYSTFNQLLVDAHQSHYDLRAQNGTLYVAIRNAFKMTDGIAITAFISAGDDFVLNILKPPPLMYQPSTIAAICQDEKSYEYKFPDEDMSTTVVSRNLQLPGQSGFANIQVDGEHLGYCKNQAYMTTQGLVPKEVTIAATDASRTMHDAQDLIQQLSSTVEKFTSDHGILGKAVDAIDGMTGTTQVFQLLASEALPIVNQLRTLLAEEKVQNAVAKVDGVAFQANYFLRLTVDVVILSYIIKTIQDFIARPNISSVFSFGIAFALFIGADVKKDLLAVLHWATSLIIPSQSEARTQGFDELLVCAETHESAIITLIGVVGTILYAYVFDAFPSMHQLKNAFKSFFHKPQMETQGKTLAEKLRNAHFSLLGLKGLKSVYEEIMEMAQQFMNWLLERENPEVIAMRAAGVHKDRVLKLLADVEKCDNEVERIKALSSTTAHDNYYRVMEEAEALTKIFLDLDQKDPTNNRLFQLISEARKHMSKILKELEKETPEHTHRYDPFVVCLHGRTGTGKTQFMKEITKVILEETNSPNYNAVYNKNIRDEFWSGYTGQAVVQWDEFGQSTEQDETVAEFMTLRGNAPMRLNMAALEDKGRQFTSKGIVLTTNVPYMRYSTIRDNNAFMRRRHMMIKMSHRGNMTAVGMQRGQNFDPEYTHCSFDITATYRDEVLQAGLDKTMILEAVRQRVRTWHAKQLAILEEGDPYPVMPRGVMLVDDENVEDELNLFDGDATVDIQDDEVVVYHPAETQGLRFQRIPGMELSAEEEFAVQMFKFNCHSISQIGRSKIQNSSRAIVQNGKLILAYLKSECQRVFKHCATTLTAWFQRYPKLMTIGAIISALVVAWNIYGHHGKEKVSVIPSDLVVEERVSIDEINEHISRTLMHETPKQQERYAIVIPSGEGKTTLVQKYPNLFCDADENVKVGKFLRPGLVNAGVLAGLMLAINGDDPWSIIGKYYRKRQPDTDKILLCHHPDFTNRKILGVFVLPQGTNVRANRLNRAELIANVEHQVLNFEEREAKILELSQSVVHGLKYNAEFAKSPRKVVTTEGLAYTSEVRKIPRQVVHTEGCEDMNALDVTRKIHPYIKRIGWAEGACKQTLMRCMFIQGRVIMVPFHFFHNALEGDEFYVACRDSAVKEIYDPKKMSRISDRDWVLYELGPRVQPHKDLSRCFIKESDLGKVKTLKSSILMVDDMDTYFMQNGNVSAVRKYKYIDPHVQEVYIQDGWYHTFNTKVGDCGSMLVGMSTALQAPHKILGVHTAGDVSKNVGFCVLTTYEDVRKALDQLREQVISFPIAQGIESDLTKAKLIPEGDYSIYGVVNDPKRCPSQPRKTDFRPTPFCNVEVPNDKKPAALFKFQKDGKTISPLAKALTKYGKETRSFPPANIRKVTKFIADWLKEFPSTFGKRVLTEQEAINGIPGVEFADRINMRSSAGWPYQVETKHTGKYYLFDDEGNITDPKLKQRLEERERLAKRGVRCVSVWRDCLKDELRLNEKVEQGKTRLFTIGPVDYTILFRRYFLDFSVMFYQTSLQHFSAVGMTPESYDWTRLKHLLESQGDNIIAGDFSSYDGTLMPELIEAVGDIVNDWYNDTCEYQRVRRVLVNEMIHTMQLVENCVYATHQGNPSGNPFTVILNTIINAMYMMNVWLLVYPEKTLDDFRQNVTIMAYGDDNLLSVRGIYGRYNQPNITRVLQHYGIEYTMEDKNSEAIESYRRLEDVTFLKRGFRKDVEFGKVALPTMAIETIQAFFHWMRYAEDEEEQLQENMRQCLQFAVFHGRKVFDTYMQMWRKHMMSVHYRPISTTFEEQRDVFLATCQMDGYDTGERQAFLHQWRHLVALA